MVVWRALARPPWENAPVRMPTERWAEGTCFRGAFFSFVAADAALHNEKMAFPSFVSVREGFFAILP